MLPSSFDNDFVNILFYGARKKHNQSIFDFGMDSWDAKMQLVVELLQATCHKHKVYLAISPLNMYSELLCLLLSEYIPGGRELLFDQASVRTVHMFANLYK